MSINNNFFQDEIFDTESFESSYYFPPVFSSSDDIVSDDVFDQFRGDSFIDSSIESDFERLDLGATVGTDIPTGTGAGAMGTGAMGTGTMGAGTNAGSSLIGLGVNPATSQGQPTTPFDQGMIQSYLRTQIGRIVRVEFLIGTNLLTDRTGVLNEVGINYIILTDASGAKVMADLYAIKFVTTAAQQAPGFTLPSQRP
ncbi:hypothetical protein [Clostridium cylindrosporum]|uniref:Uncharacterized protein n=1 Tax=Clostridium cylindrosporum DSM 605 TaxID=1121307 RepID=A0A0J8D9B8_CLOCY|nr:hypothetical protein [Clostridium cylindrosporum]KMT20883.1 hypothetical protein CLCY_1c01170 [Clostridium cylindrosporum DSM 605]